MRIRKMARPWIGMLGVLMTLAMAVAGPVPQQKPSGASDNAQPAGRFEYMSRELKLTADQKPKVRAIVDAQMAEWETLGKNKTLNGKQKIERMKEINQSAQGRIEKLLTAEQKKKLDAIMAESKPQPGKPVKNPQRKPRNVPPEP